MSYPDFSTGEPVRVRSPSLAAYQDMTMNVSDSGHPPERAHRRARVSTNAFSIIGERPIRGRDFADGEDRKGAEPVAILGYGLWKTRYGSDPNDHRHSPSRSMKSRRTVIGVMAEGMRFPTNTDVWIHPDSRRRHGAA